MSDEQYVEGLRKEIGEKMARDGEPLHPGASDSARRGHKRGEIGWGSNVTPLKFGKGRETKKDNWVCVCETSNRYYLVQCGNCGIRRSLAQEVNSGKN